MIRFALIAASTLGFVLMAAFGNLMVPLLRELERFRLDKEESSQQPEEPAGQPVPTLGGLCLMMGVLAAVGVGWTAACVAQPDLLGSGQKLAGRLLIGLFGALAFGAVGLADDLVCLRSRSPLGLRRGTRLALEAAVSAAVLALLGINGCLPWGITLLGGRYVTLSGLAPVLWGTLLVALAECARMADGADGTVCGAAFTAMLGLMCAQTQLGWFPLAVFPAAVAGALMAFLLWNFPPAKLRPGKCGCLFLAGAIGCVPLSFGSPGLAVPLALPFWMEGGMVVLQMVHFRRTGRPLFAAAPLHRWLEKRGADAVTVFCWLCAFAVCGLALALGFVRMS